MKTNSFQADFNKQNELNKKISDCADIALQIKERAMLLGYVNCGIIKVEAVAGYAGKLRERMSRVRWGRLQFGMCRNYANPRKRHAWAKSIVIALNDNTVYNIPEILQGVIAKDYLIDGRMDKQSDAYIRRNAFENYLASTGVMFLGEPKFGITALRYAAAQAGLGIIRRNNFFYTENGSSVIIDAWLIDRELELIDTVRPPRCAENCMKCISACPTKALSAPYTTSLFDCVSFLTSLSVEKGLGIPPAKLKDKFGGRVYGCDTCQDVCPYNAGKWTGGKEFPGLNELSGSLLPEKIMELSYEEIEKMFAPKFWYISVDNIWKWKLNALTALENMNTDSCKGAIRLGLTDRDRRVRRYAKSSCKRLGI